MFLKSRFGNFAPLILYITIHWYRCYCLTYVFASPHIFKAVILSTRCANAHSRSKSWLKQKHFLSHVSAEGRKLLWVTRREKYCTLPVLLFKFGGREQYRCTFHLHLNFPGCNIKMYLSKRERWDKYEIRRLSDNWRWRSPSTGLFIVLFLH